jgi:conjugal transfer pilus assembly protein TraL
MDKYHVPQHLDMPFKIVIWTADEFVVFVVPFFFILSIFNAPLTGVAVGGGLMVLLKKLKGEEGHHFILHLIYWYLPPMVRYKVIPPSYCQEIIG